METEEFYTNVYELVTTHPHFLAMYGVVAYFILLWSLSKDKYDHDEKKFCFKKWWSKNYDNFLVTMVIVPLVIIYDEEVVSIIKRIFDYEIQTNSFVYILSCPIVDLLYSAVNKLRRK